MTKKEDRLEAYRKIAQLANAASHVDSAMGMWRILLDLADAALGEKITEEEWAGVCRTVYAELRAEERRQSEKTKDN